MTQGRHSAATGGLTNDWALLLKDEVEKRGNIAFVFDMDPPEYVAKLLRTLGVEIFVERGAELRVGSL